MKADRLVNIGWGIAVVGILFAADILAQTVENGALDQADENAKPASIELDLEALLQEQEIRTTSVNGPIWRIEPRPNRQLVQIPLRLQPGERESDFRSTNIKMRGGRLLAYRFEQAGESEEDHHTSGSGRIGAGFSGQIGPRGLVRRSFPQSSISPRFASRGGTGQPRSDTHPEEQIPLLTRRFKLTPDGMIKWNLDRTISGGKVESSESLYAFKINRRLLEEQNPQSRERPTRTTSRRLDSSSRRSTGVDRRTVRSRGDGDRSREAIDQQRKQRGELQAKRQSYTELRKRVMKLPTEFQAPLPPRVWAIFETPQKATRLDLQGLTPGPWTISFDQLQTVLVLSSSTWSPEPGDVQGLPFEIQRHIQVVQELIVKQNHPYSYRIVALALSRSGLAPHAHPGDPLFALSQAIIQGPDNQARDLMIENLVSNTPMTPAAHQLLMLAKDLDPTARLLMLQGLLQSARDPTQLHEVIGTANRLLADSEGPAAAPVLGMLLDAARTQQQAVGLRALGGGIRFDQLTGRRRDEAIAFVLEMAGSEPLAATWLDQQLIGSPRPELVQNTLKLISQAGPASMRPFVHGVLNLVFGQPRRSDSSEAVHATIPEPLPMNSHRHSLFRALQHSDKRHRHLAWRALPRFRFRQDIGERQSRDGQPDGYTILVEAGLGESPHPLELVRFLASQADQDQVAVSLLHIVLRGDRPVATVAGRALLGSGLNLEKYVSELSYSKRYEFARRLYHVLEDREPLVTALMGQQVERSTVTNWFAREIALVGVLPDPSRWVEGYGGEDAILQLIASSPEDLALAGLAALVAHAGGDESRVKDLAEKSRPDLQKSGADLASLWPGIRRDIYLERMQEATGAYRLAVMVYGDAVAAAPGADIVQPGGFGFADPRSAIPPGFRGGPAGGGLPLQEADLPAREPNLVIDLGVVHLRADGQSVNLENNSLQLSVSEEWFALRIEKLDELKNFPGDDLAQLPLERITYPIDLPLLPDGSWQGQVLLPDQRTAVIVLDPMQEE